MFVASYSNTMRNAKPKFRQSIDEEVIIRDIRAIRSERIQREIEAEKKRKAEQDRLRAERRKQAIQRIEEVYQCAKEMRSHERVLARDIIKAVAAEHGVTFEDIVGPRRHKWLIPIRFEAIRRVADMRPDLGMPKIGRIFNRDHTTILNALKKTASKPGEHRPIRNYGKHD